MNMIKRICAVAVLVSMILSTFTIGYAEESAAVAAPSEAYVLATSLGVFTGVDIKDPNAEITGADFVKAMNNVLGYNSAAVYADIASNNRVKLSEVSKVFVDLLGYGVMAEKDGGYPIGYLTQALSLKLLNKLDLTAGQSVTYSDFAQILSNSLQVDLLKLVVYGEKKTYETQKGRNFIYEIMGMRKVEGQVTGNNVTDFKTLEGLGANVVKIDNVSYQIDANTFYINNMIGHYVIAYYKEYENQTSSELRTLVYAKNNDKYESIVIKAEDINDFYDYELKYQSDDSIKELKSTIAKDANIIYNGVVETTYTKDIFEFDEGTVELIEGPRSGYGTVIITDYRDYVVSGKDENKFIIYNKIYDNDLLTTDESITLDVTDPTDCIYINDTEGKTVMFEDIRVGDVLSVARNGSYANVILSRNVLKDFQVTKVLYYQAGDTNVDGVVDDEDVAPEFDANGDGAITPEDIKAKADTISSADKEVKISRAFLNSRENIDVLVNKGYTISLNAFGKAAYIVNGKSTDLFAGYLVKYVIPEGLGLKSTMQMKIFRSDGVMVRLSTAEKITLMNHRGETSRVDSATLAKTLINYGQEDSTENKGLVWYRLNSEGQIIMLQLALTDPDPTMPDRTHKIRYKEGMGTDYYVYRETPKTYGGQFYVGTGAIVYLIPKDLSADEEFSIQPISYLKGGDRYNEKTTVYSNDLDGVVLNNIVFNNVERDVEIRAHALVVLSVGRVMNKDGVQFKRVIGMQDGSKVVLDSYDDGINQSAFDRAYDIPFKTIPDRALTYSIQPGDVIRYTKIPSTQIVDKVQLLFRAKERNQAYPNGQLGHLTGTLDVFDPTLRIINGNPYSINEKYIPQADARIITSGVFRIYYGWVYKKNGSIITVTTQDLSLGNYTPNPFNVVESYNASIYGKFTTVNLKDDDVTAKLGSIADINAFKDVGTSCSRVIVTGFWGEITQLIVINGELDKSVVN